MPVISLIFIAAAALVNFWLAMRCGQVRRAEKISHGDGGSPLLSRRMRAQLNFAENTPIIMLLVLALELAGANSDALWAISAIYIVGRICHALGMDPDSSKLRMIGVLATFLITLALAGWAIYTGYNLMGTMAAPDSMAAAL